METFTRNQFRQTDIQLALSLGPQIENKIRMSLFDKIYLFCPKVSQNRKDNCLDNQEIRKYICPWTKQDYEKFSKMKFISIGIEYS